MMYILIRKSTTSELRKSISASLVNQQLTERANLDSNNTVFYHALITG